MELIQLMAKFATNKVAPIDLIFILWCFRGVWTSTFLFICWQPRVHLAAHSPKEPSHSIFTIPRNSFGRTFQFFYFLLFTFPHLLPFSSEVLASKSSFGSSKERATNWASLSPILLWPFLRIHLAGWVWWVRERQYFHFSGSFLLPSLSFAVLWRTKCPSDQILLFPPRALYCDYWCITQRTLKNNEVRTHPSHPLIAPQCYIRFLRANMFFEEFVF